MRKDFASLRVRCAAAVAGMFIVLCLLGCAPATQTEGDEQLPPASAGSVQVQAPAPAPEPLKDVVWDNNWALCPHCRNEVALGSSTCGHCTKDFNWVSKDCPLCAGAGKVKCMGGLLNEHGVLSSLSTFKGRTVVVNCNEGKAVTLGDLPSDVPKGTVVRTCERCNGSGKMDCVRCRGTGKMG